jgi:hypothetical protein
MSDIHREILITRVSAITGAMLEFQTHSTTLADALRSEGKSERQVVAIVDVIMDLSTVGEGVLTPLEVALVRYADYGNVRVPGEVLEEMRRVVVKVAGMKEEEIVEAVISARSIVCVGCWTVCISKMRRHWPFEPPRARL